MPSPPRSLCTCMYSYFTPFGTLHFSFSNWFICFSSFSMMSLFPFAYFIGYSIVGMINDCNVLYVPPSFSPFLFLMVCIIFVTLLTTPSCIEPSYISVSTSFVSPLLFCMLPRCLQNSSCFISATFTALSVLSL